MIAELLVLFALPALLAAAAGWDLASYTIPNFVSLALIAAFLVFIAATGFHLSMLGWHVLAGIAGLIIGFALFALGWIGGGDAKLFAAMALWLGFHDLMSYALVASVLGGLLTIALVMMRGRPLPAFLARQNWILRLHDKTSGIPYGVALAVGAFVLLPQTEIFRLAGAA